MADKEWKFPKFLDMEKYERLIMEFGNVFIANASYGERSHKDLKEFKSFTNNHQATLILQVGDTAVLHSRRLYALCLRS